MFGCHFSRSEQAFIYDFRSNQYREFDRRTLAVDMYRSNDVAQVDSKSFVLRPFVKVGEAPDTIKCFQYFVQDADASDVITPQKGFYTYDETMQDGPKKSDSILSRLQNLF